MASELISATLEINSELEKSLVCINLNATIGRHGRMAEVRHRKDGPSRKYIEQVN